MMNFAFKMMNSAFKMMNSVFKMMNSVFKMMDYVFKMMNYVFKMMNYAFKMMNYAFKMMNYVFKMMNSVFKMLNSVLQGQKFSPVFSAISCGNANINTKFLHIFHQRFTDFLIENAEKVENSPWRMMNLYWKMAIYNAIRGMSGLLVSFNIQHSRILIYHKRILISIEEPWFPIKESWFPVQESWFSIEKCWFYNKIRRSDIYMEWMVWKWWILH